MIVPIVEGQSEQLAVPVLMRRILQDRGLHGVGVRRGFRVRRDKLVKQGELERSVEFARRQPGARAVVVVLDSDEDCPKILAPSLLARGTIVASDCPFSVVLAKRELEAWFIAGIESLRGRRGIRDDASRPPDPENIGGAKGWLTKNMRQGYTYVPADDQPALAQLFDYMGAARHSRSLRKFIKDVEQIGQSL